MKRKNILILLLLLVIPFVNTFSTAQVGDRLIYKGDTLILYSNPLETFLYKFATRPKLFDENYECISTACWRGYQAQWEIIDNQLYLTAIYSCCYYEDSIKADLKSLFETRYVDGKVRADWVTGRLIAVRGGLLYYIHDGFESVYEKEFVLQVNEGQVVETEIHDNSKSKQSAYSQDDKLLYQFIYSNIKWDDLPPLNDYKIRVLVQFSANENGIIDSVKVVRGYNNVLDNEAVRVIKAIPEWDVYYRRGKHKRVKWTLPIIFSEENRKEYNKKH